MSYYVMQVMGGREETTAKLCRYLIKDQNVLEDCFIPKYVRKRKVKGEWIDEKSIIFKGYVFLITDNIAELYNALKMVPNMTKVIGKKKEEIYPLLEAEVLSLSRFIDEKHTLGLSRGYIEGGVTYITEGPLQGQEAYIKKIDRHKREALVQVSFLGETRDIKVGLEIISKNA